MIRCNMRVAALIAVAALIGFADASCPLGTYNNKPCSGYGQCTPLNQCVCDSRHTGFDCSQGMKHLWFMGQLQNLADGSRCPMGNAWVAPANAAGNAHYLTECSNKGICDRSKGVCECMDGFTGSACQRMSCPNRCSDAGECLSLKQLSMRYAVATEPLYDSVWDAEMIYGCKCRKGFEAYDCSKRSCPRGDDPMTTGQVNEIQIVQCSATSGSFWLFFNGQGALIPATATLNQFQDALRSIQTLSTVKVTFGAGNVVCNQAVINAIQIEFIAEFGPQPPIKVYGSWNGANLVGGDVFAASAGTTLAGRMSVKGTKEWEPCSNRGVCDLVTGACTCFIVPMPGYRSSDGYGNPGARGDCGCANNNNKYGGAIKACPGELACSGHGYCAGSPSFRCGCQKGWSSGDCSLSTFESEQVDVAETDNEPVRWDRLGFEHQRVPTRCIISSPRVQTRVSVIPVLANATAIHHSQEQHVNSVRFDFRRIHSVDVAKLRPKVKCPGEPVCSGHGRCMSVRQLSLEADVDNPSQRFDYGSDPNNAATFDGNSILGCKCDKGYEGYDCSQRSCPLGDDPVTTGQVDEIQLLKCTANGGAFQLTYRTFTTANIPFDAPPAVLRSSILRAFGLEEVIVTYSSGQAACTPPSTPTRNVISLLFPIDHGNLPPINAITASLVLTEAPGIATVVAAENGVAIDGIVSQAGTKESIACSNKGICNFETGTCMCTKGYGSSDGQGRQGGRGDCGFVLRRVAAE
ncbi:TPA: hypothetical protein N0F65_002086 [Lagenidium giganteum]|uniref:EGF-like domain-containing protein n=1 Tax=Lagenidium giganteum TaxID=4803 RepID=A0AAV2ZHD4_9STRA|nr:TPA: hypothetical protein N0F65_002086 [Lagenidium giganteum]